MTRASETTGAPTVDAIKRPGKSGEGAGADLLDDDFDGRLTMSVTESMHEVSLRIAWAVG